MKTYYLFEEIENEILQFLPPIIYKYRNWEDNWHKKVILNHELWFAHPHSLNDPYDVRPPYNFIVSEIDRGSLENQLRIAGRALEPHLTSIELEAEVKKKIKAIELDPIGYFRKNRLEMIQDSYHYDGIGVLSMCSTCDNEAMWAHYGNNNCGFAVGFDTKELARTLNCYFGLVDYQDDPIDYYIFGNNEGILETELFRKSTKWKVEDEIRFITIRIGSDKSRANVFPGKVVKEIIFGLNTSQDVIDEIFKIATGLFPQAKFYKLNINVDSYGYSKSKL